MLSPKCWYKKSVFNWLLVPLTWPFNILLNLRKWVWQKLWPNTALPVPVVVVGNISVGGTGKTPFVIELVKQLHQAGFYPGVISRGYGRKSKTVCSITPDSTAAIVGDEPLFIYQQTGCPVVVGAKRYEAAQMLLEQHRDINVIISDDGLQHYALPRDIEIALLHHTIGHGNGLLLPFGPLREPVSRLKDVDFVVQSGQYQAKGYAQNLITGERRNLSEFNQVHAVAGIAHPEHFFALLEAHDINVIRYPFSDHHTFELSDFHLHGLPILMTEKDGVKCISLAIEAWVVPVITKSPEQVVNDVIARLRSKYGS